MDASLNKQINRILRLQEESALKEGTETKGSYILLLGLQVDSLRVNRLSEK